MHAYILIYPPPSALLTYLIRTLLTKHFQEQVLKSRVLLLRVLERDTDALLYSRWWFDSGEVERGGRGDPLRTESGKI